LLPIYQVSLVDGFVISDKTEENPPDISIPYREPAEQGDTLPTPRFLISGKHGVYIRIKPISDTQRSLGFNMRLKILDFMAAIGTARKYSIARSKKDTLEEEEQG
jgi:hypothetical protein